MSVKRRRGPIRYWQLSVTCLAQLYHGTARGRPETGASKCECVPGTSRVLGDIGGTPPIKAHTRPQASRGDTPYILILT
jgi:hypothetical protein